MVKLMGETYKLQGVLSSAHFVMENSLKYRSTIKAKLYNGKMYYDSTSIYQLSGLRNQQSGGVKYVFFIGKQYSYCQASE